MSILSGLVDRPPLGTLCWYDFRASFKELPDHIDMALLRGDL